MILIIVHGLLGLTGVLKRTPIFLQMVKQLGGELAKSARDATHLVMSKPARTFKLLCCISTCKHIVSVNWLKDSCAHNTFLGTEKNPIL